MTEIKHKTIIYDGFQLHPGQHYSLPVTDDHTILIKLAENQSHSVYLAYRELAVVPLDNIQSMEQIMNIWTELGGKDYDDRMREKCTDGTEGDVQ